MAGQGLAQLDGDLDRRARFPLFVEGAGGCLSVAQFQRAIAVYGLITLRTDGENVILAQKLEKRSGTREFDYHCLEANDGELVYNPDR